MKCDHKGTWMECSRCKNESTLIRVRGRVKNGTPLYHPTVDDLPRSDEVDARNAEGGKA